MSENFLARIEKAPSIHFQKHPQGRQDGKVCYQKSIKTCSKSWREWATSGWGWDARRKTPPIARAIGQFCLRRRPPKAA
ncbi:hypothetical protein EII20_14040 [Comamonadaceae bacterium OH2545_COT-014]|nr:hypothetical protein EII20_14040 [Comamonadaceae bacterium OH2545_COT-014]